MDREAVIRNFFQDVISQNEVGLGRWFREDAVIRWHCTNEQFSAEEYIRANCEYPGRWNGTIERVEQGKDTAVTAARVWCEEAGISNHVVSFYRFDGDTIVSLDEYWGDDGPAPQWHLEMKLGRPIGERP